MVYTEEIFLGKPQQKRSLFKGICFSLSKRILLGCLMISWICSVMVILRLMKRSSLISLSTAILVPLNGTLNHWGNLSNISKISNNFYSIGSPEIARVASINFQGDKVYHVNGVGYDKYSISELGQTNVARQWLTFPLPNELHRSDYPSPWYPNKQLFRHYEKSFKYPMVFPINKSPPTLSGLAYVEQIYVVTDQSFIERHKQLKNAFHRHSIPVESIDFRWKWNRTTCQMKENWDEIKKKLNPAKGNRIRRQYCPIIMKHVDIWHEMVERRISLAFILEDDPIFVPFFKEKFNRVIYTAIRTGALRLNRTCLNETQKPIDDQEWINQEPMFVIGTCLGMLDGSFQKHVANAQPILTTHKQNPSRCAHAYLITSCAAKAMINTIAKHQSNTDTPDFYMNLVYPRSSVLQSFWIDPPLVYQGNRVVDLEHLGTYTGSMYNRPLKN